MRALLSLLIVLYSVTAALPQAFWMGSVNGAGGGSPPPSSNVNSPLGINLAYLYGTGTEEQPFLNIVKLGGGWHTFNGNTETGEDVALYKYFLDSNGYPTTLTGTPPGAGSHTFTSVRFGVLVNYSSSDRSQPTYKAGDYLLQWTGTGNISYINDATGTCTVSPCKITISSPSDAGLVISINSVGTSPNYVQNLSLIYCGTWSGTACSNGYDTLLAGGEMFDPVFINSLKPYKMLRFMDWMATKVNFQVNWIDRQLPGWVFWNDNPMAIQFNFGPHNSNNGVPAEAMFALCNEANADCWFNMPPLSTNAYVSSFAGLAHTSITGTKKVYVEYSNEMWSQGLCGAQGTMTADCVHQVAVLCANLVGTGTNQCPYPASFTTYQANTTYSGVQAPIVRQLWRTAWGADANRVIGVFGGWNGTTGYQSYFLNFTDPSTSPHWTGPLWQNVDAWALAPYVGCQTPNTLMLDQLFTEFFVGGAPGVTNPPCDPGGMLYQTMTTWAKVNFCIMANDNINCPTGCIPNSPTIPYCIPVLPIVGYEAGQNLYDNGDSMLITQFIQANRDARMGAVYYTDPSNPVAGLPTGAQPGFLNQWKALGGQMLAIYDDIQHFSSQNYWGNVENFQLTTSPKQNAINAFITANPCWWAGCTAP